MATKKKTTLTAEAAVELQVGTLPEQDEQVQACEPAASSEKSSLPQTGTEMTAFTEGSASESSISQTDPEAELSPEDASQTESGNASEVPQAPDDASGIPEHTLPDKTELETAADAAPQEEGLPASECLSQTEPKTAVEAANSGIQEEEHSATTSLYQTEQETGVEKKAAITREGVHSAAASLYQTEPKSVANEIDLTTPEAESTADKTETAEPAKKTRRRRKADETQSDTAAEISADDVIKEPAAKKKRAAKPGLTVLSIDEQRTVETDADKAQNDLLDLLESQKTGRILSGTIQGVERPSDNHSHSVAVIYRGAYKVLIPAEEAVEPPSDYRDQDPRDVMHYLLTKRLGAEVDYIVKGIDAGANIAVASRLEAMKAKRKQYYFGLDRDKNNLLYSGLCAEARVVSVIRAGIFAELFGLEIYIPLRELSYQRMMDASGYFQPGQRILVKILEIDRSDRNQVRAMASVKQAAENPYESALRKYTVGNRYVGTVSMVDTNGVFVALDGGIDCLCSYPKRGRPPRGARVTVRILGINHDTNRIWGAITHTATPR